MENFRKSETQKDSIANELSQLRSKYRQTMRDFSSIKENTEKLTEAIRIENSGYQNQLSLLNDTISKMDAQLSQKQSLIDTLQVQRADLYRELSSSQGGSSRAVHSSSVSLNVSQGSGSFSVADLTSSSGNYQSNFNYGANTQVYSGLNPRPSSRALDESVGHLNKLSALSSVLSSMDSNASVSQAASRVQVATSPTGHRRPVSDSSGFHSNAMFSDAKGNVDSNGDAILSVDIKNAQIRHLSSSFSKKS